MPIWFPSSKEYIYSLSRSSLPSGTVPRDCLSTAYRDYDCRPPQRHIDPLSTHKYGIRAICRNGLRDLDALQQSILHNLIDYPHFLASTAPIFPPVNTISDACDHPILRTSRGIVPPSRDNPTCTSSKENTALGERMTISQFMRTSMSFRYATEASRWKHPLFFFRIFCPF